MKLETTLYQTVLYLYLYFKVNFLASLEKSAPATLLNFCVTSFLISSMHDANKTCLRRCHLFWKKQNIHKVSSQPTYDDESGICAADRHLKGSRVLSALHNDTKYILYKGYYENVARCGATIYNLSISFIFFQLLITWAVLRKAHWKRVDITEKMY